MDIFDDTIDEHAYTLFPQVEQPDNVYNDAIAILGLDKYPFISNSIIEESVNSAVESTPLTLGDKRTMITLAGDVVKSIHAFVEHVGRCHYLSSNSTHKYRNLEPHQTIYIAVTKWLKENGMAVNNRKVWRRNVLAASPNIWECVSDDTERMMHDCIPAHTSKESLDRMWRLVDEDQEECVLRVLPVFSTSDGDGILFENQSCNVFDAAEIMRGIKCFAYRSVFPVATSSIVGTYDSPESIPFTDDAEQWLRFFRSVTADECLNPFMFWIAAAVQTIENRKKFFSDRLKFVLVIDDSEVDGIPNDLLCAWYSVLRTIADSIELMKGNCIMYCTDPPQPGWLHWALKSDTIKMTEGWKTRSHLCLHYDHDKYVKSGRIRVPEPSSCVGLICRSVSIMHLCTSHPFVMDTFDMTMHDSLCVNPPKIRALSSIMSKMTRRDIWEEIVLTQYMWKPVPPLPENINMHDRSLADAVFKFCITGREIIMLIKHWAEHHGVTIDPISIQISPNVALSVIERYYGKHNAVKYITMRFDSQWAISGIASDL